MNFKTRRERAIFELMLITVAVGITYLMHEMGQYKMVALNLFFLPIVLSGYYLGRSSAGILALFCALAVTVATAVNPMGFATGTNSPIMIGLAVTVWAAVLGLSAILVGTLCDERAAKVQELQEAYIGVVEVMSRYLQSGDPKVKARSIRVAELCQVVAEEMNLSRKQIEDIRVGALLHDLGNVEITTKLISRAMDSLESPPAGLDDRHTFLGMDLVQSLGSVLHGAVPLLLRQDDMLQDVIACGDDEDPEELPIGARIIRAVREFDRRTMSEAGAPVASPRSALREMQEDGSSEYGSDVLEAIRRVVERNAGVETAHREHAMV